MENVNSLMIEVNQYIKDILKDNYVGVYFHGSLRLGSFNPNKSDLDFIIVVKQKLGYQIKKLICDKMLENLDKFPKKGFEFSVILEEYCQKIIHPMPYELHMSIDWVEKYRNDDTSVINDLEKFDADLVSHINVINVKNDGMDFGKTSKEVFEKVPKEYVIDSNYGDVLECVDNIKDNPVYCILNLCRFYALIRDDLTLSKYDGGKWALDNMDSKYNDIIQMAMDDYLGDSKLDYDEASLVSFAKEAIEKINIMVNRE